MLFILVQSPSPIRHAFYETFLHLHIGLACVSVGFLWHHVYRYSCRYYLYAAVAFWAFEVSPPCCGCSSENRNKELTSRFSDLRGC